MPNFRELLSQSADKFEKPKPLPPGTYFGTLTTHEFGESKEKKTPYVKFTLRVHSAGDDVDPNDLLGIDLAHKKLYQTFYMTEDANYRIKDLAVSCQVQVQGRSMGEIIDDLINIPVVMAVTQRNGRTPEDVYNDVGAVKGAV